MPGSDLDANEMKEFLSSVDPAFGEELAGAFLAYTVKSISQLSKLNERNQT